MVLAAGLGMRMRPITLRVPKPLVPIAGTPLIDYALDALAEARVERAVVNVHHLPGRMRDHLANRRRPETVISDETDVLMDSGGGIVKALPQLGPSPFFVLNADSFWLEESSAPTSNLRALSDAFSSKSMDMLLMLARPDQATGYEGRGDFVFEADGRLARYDGANGEPLVYAGALVCHPRIFADAPEGAFSLNRCFDAAIESGRLYGMAMRGHWLTVGTPDAIGKAGAFVSRHRSTEVASA
ncbi:nucleotidyltransferase family protein [Pararhizobium mangrovi]|uniref:Nucleotidyltransferase family protein n=1 Tax=Pararhizobium mangrovi TaxID=2590452 RepID=A0A506U722_9HYPH|nr:nucleotidyltransferase family protein [Pararhizobium mangrovi]TPW28419.1 nucleotidyltransferase family protein [Pararhizobium mangrovi]